MLVPPRRQLALLVIDVNVTQMLNGLGTPSRIIMAEPLRLPPPSKCGLALSGTAPAELTSSTQRLSGLLAGAESWC